MLFHPGGEDIYIYYIICILNIYIYIVGYIAYCIYLSHVQRYAHHDVSNNSNITASWMVPCSHLSQWCLKQLSKLW